MLQAGGELDLAQEAIDIELGGEGGMKDLECNRPVVAQVAGSG